MKNCYGIIKTLSAPGGEARISLVMDDTGLQYLSFANREEARAWIRRLEGRAVDLHSRDHGPSTYAVAEVGSASFCEAYKRTLGAEWSVTTG